MCRLEACSTSGSHSGVEEDYLLLILILQTFDRLAAFQLELLQAILFIAVKISAPLFLAICFKCCSQGLPTAFFPDVEDYSLL